MLHRLLTLARLEPVVRDARYRVAERRDVREAVRVELWLIALFVGVDSVIFGLVSPQLLLVSVAGAVALALLVMAAASLGRRRPHLIGIGLGAIICARMAIVWLLEPAFGTLIFGYLLVVTVAAALFVPWNPRWHLVWLVVASVPLWAGVIASGPDMLTQLEVLMAGCAALATSAAGNQLVARRRERTWLQEEVLRSQRRTLRSIQARLEAAVNEDALTGLFNRRRLEIDAARPERRGRRGRLAVLMVDIDRFKEFNDGAGHRAGDQALRSVADAVRRAVRSSDDVYRYGGEEILVVATVDSAVTARQLAARVHDAIGGLGIPRPGQGRGTLSASIGLAVTDDVADWTFHDVLDAADQALYRAKDLGRDRVEVSPSVEAPTRSIVALSRFASSTAGDGSTTH
jgi:diguanylate cyclase (GGDEF)-like protein